MKHSRRKTKTKTKTKISVNQMVFILIMSIFLCGLIVGIILVEFVSPEEITKIQQKLNDTVALKQSEPFEVRLIAYSRLILIIWVLAYIPIGGYIALATLFAKGISIGFAVAIILQYNQNELGLLSIVILVPAYVFITYCNFSFLKMQFKPKSSTKKDVGVKECLQYFLCLGMGIICAVLASI